MPKVERKRRVYNLRESVLTAIGQRLGSQFMKSVRSPMEKFEVLVVKKLHWIIGITMTIITPTVTVTAAYYRGRADIDAEISKVRQEQEQLFVRKEQINRLMDKIDSLATQVAEMNGTLKVIERQRRQ